MANFTATNYTAFHAFMLFSHGARRVQASLPSNGSITVPKAEVTDPRVEGRQPFRIEAIIEGVTTSPLETTPDQQDSEVAVKLVDQGSRDLPEYAVVFR